MSRRTQDPTRLHIVFGYGTCTPCGRPFNAVLLTILLPCRGPTTPSLEMVWAPSLSLAATQEITFVFFSSGYLDVSVLRVPLSWTMDSSMDAILLQMTGFPIRISTDLCVRTTPRRVSPFVASFFSFKCLGIHRTPLLTKSLLRVFAFGLLEYYCLFNFILVNIYFVYNFYVIDLLLCLFCYSVFKDRLLLEDSFGLPKPNRKYLLLCTFSLERR